MGTKVQYKSSLPGYYPMRDLKNDSDSRSWHLLYGERAVTNTQYHNVFLPRTGANGYLGDNKDVMKQKMLEHEAIFKNQVFELHRLYRIQRDLMDKIKSTELCRKQLPVESLFSSSPLGSQVTSEAASRRNFPGFAVANSSSARLSVTVAEESHSSLNSVKGNSLKPSSLPSQIGNPTEDPQFLESRPTKLRRKMLDLQLPADEYIDSEDGEQFHDENVPSTLSHPEIKYHKAELEKDLKLFADDGQKTGFLQDVGNGACLANRSCLADLNEPVLAVETSSSSFVDPLGSASCPSSGAKSGLIDFQRKKFPHNGSYNVTTNSLQLDKNLSSGGVLPHFLESGPSYSYSKFSSQGLPNKMWPVSSQAMQNFHNEINKAPPFYPTYQGKVEQPEVWPLCELQFSKRSYEINGKQPVSFVPSHIPPRHADFGQSWYNSNSSWESANTNFQKSTSAKTQQCLKSAATSHENLRLPFHGIESFEEGWYLGNDSRHNKGNDSKIPYHNGSVLGFSSEIKEEVNHFSSINYNYWKCCNDKNRAPEDLTHGLSLKPLKDSNSMVVTNGFSSGAEQKIGQNCAFLPSLRGTSAGDNETTNSGMLFSTEDPSYVRSSNCLPDKNGSDNNPSHIVHHTKSCSFHNDILLRKFEAGECLSSRKCHGLTVSEAEHDSKNERSSLALPSADFLGQSEVEDNRKDIVDINLPCDPLLAELDKHVAADIPDTDEHRETKVSGRAHLIDLNLCLSDDEASLRSTPKTTIKTWGEIDLEAPAISEADDIIPSEEIIEIKHELASKPQCKAIRQHDELRDLAAEAIVSISSSVSHSYLDAATCSAAQDSLENPLNWLAEMALSCGNDLQSECQAPLRAKPRSGKEEVSLQEMDSFESMMLGLTETKEEEYMPEPLVPGHVTVEQQATTLLQNRVRKGQARRGRQRRDFQRDILPGLTSLSKLEVTEDLNTFGGIMRATGHLWNSGLTKRNSSKRACGRGRCRSVVSPSACLPVNFPLMNQLNIAEMGLEEGSLTGWGKTTRRPRRQRVPAAAGNLAAIPLV